MAAKKKGTSGKKTSKTKGKVRKKSTRATKTNRTPNKKPLGTCFVMMPFKEPYGSYHDTIFAPAIKKAKLEPERADDLFRPGTIVNDLWRMIQNAEVLLAELTTKNANVFYELGLSHAIGKPVILVCETMDDVPFDLRQLRVLLYNKDDPNWGDKLSEAITKAINETLADPIESVPSVFRKTVPSQGPKQTALEARLDALESRVRSIGGLAGVSSRPGGVMSSELAAVSESSQLDGWIRKWNRLGMPDAVLQQAIREARNIPPGREKRVRMITGDRSRE